jgi:large conductance mechanosensitive channel
MLKEFKEFAVKGNMLDMAVGIIIGAAFATIVGSLVADIIMPPVGLALGGVDFAEAAWTLPISSSSLSKATLRVRTPLWRWPRKPVPSRSTGACSSTA